MRVVVAVLVLVITLAYAQTVDFFLWSKADGTNIILQQDGTVKQLSVIWVGYSANYDITAIKAWVTQTYANSAVPFINAYHLSGIKYGTQNATFTDALNFDTELAKAIGNNFAIVNLDPEWDAPSVVGSAQSTDGLAFFNSRITAWRTNAPAAHLTSSPTFDGAADKSVEYAFFKPIDSQLDSRSTVFWAPSNDPACTWRVLAGETANTSYTDGRTEDDAEQVSGYLSSALNFENQYWGLADKKFLTTDVAITKCGWGSAGRVKVIQNLVSSMYNLVGNGWRGIVLRNQPSSEGHKYMGEGNENGFVWTDDADSVSALTEGLDLARTLLFAKWKINVTTSAPDTGTLVINEPTAAPVPTVAVTTTTTTAAPTEEPTAPTVPGQTDAPVPVVTVVRSLAPLKAYENTVLTIYGSNLEANSVCRFSNDNDNNVQDSPAVCTADSCTCASPRFGSVQDDSIWVDLISPSGNYVNAPAGRLSFVYVDPSKFVVSVYFSDASVVKNALGGDVAQLGAAPLVGTDLVSIQGDQTVITSGFSNNVARHALLTKDSYSIVDNQAHVEFKTISVPDPVPYGHVIELSLVGASFVASASLEQKSNTLNIVYNASSQTRVAQTQCNFQDQVLYRLSILIVQEDTIRAQVETASLAPVCSLTLKGINVAAYRNEKFAIGISQSNVAYTASARRARDALDVLDSDATTSTLTVYLSSLSLGCQPSACFPVAENPVKSYLPLIIVGSALGGAFILALLLTAVVITVCIVRRRAKGKEAPEAAQVGTGVDPYARIRSPMTPVSPGGATVELKQLNLGVKGNYAPVKVTSNMTPVEQPGTFAVLMSPMTPASPTAD